MKKKTYRERVKSIRIAPFPQELRVVVTSDIREAARRRDDYFKDPLSPVASAVTWNSDHVTVQYMLLPEDADNKIIVHESVHVITHVMRQNGVEFEEEVWAYHLDELFSTIVKFLHKKPKIRRKNGSHKKP